MKTAGKPDDLGASLEDLIGAAEAIAGGDRERRLPVAADADLGRLATAVNEIAERLLRNEDLLGENIRSLQRVNKQLREAQETLVRSEKLATIGRLAAGVAHEIGNPLGAIVGYLDILKREAGLGEETRNWLSRMDGEARRIDVIIRELLDFSRPSDTALVAIDVNEVVESALSLVSHQKMFSKVRLQRELAASLPAAMAERHRLRQVLVNLLMNSCDAMPDGGGIRLKTEVATAPLEQDPAVALPPRRSDDPPQADYSHLRPTLVHDPTSERRFESRARWIRIRVADEGRGIPPAELREVFDPFFTTKPPGKGTGLGLAIALSTIQSFRGRIHIESRVNVGTTVTVEAALSLVSHQKMLGKVKLERRLGNGLPAALAEQQASSGGREPPHELVRRTTKPPGEGTGLGLAIALSTIQSFGGRIEVASRVNQGTTVSIELPVAE
ncbi:MAG: ATP-binding protein [Candidatus Binatia bacterium]